MVSLERKHLLIFVFKTVESSSEIRREEEVVGGEEVVGREEEVVRGEGAVDAAVGEGDREAVAGKLAGDAAVDSGVEGVGKRDEGGERKVIRGGAGQREAACSGAAGG